MAGRGPAPTTTKSRNRDTKRAEEELTVVEPDSEVRGPELPDGFEWPEATTRWWATWRESAQAKTFTPTDWDFLTDTAVLHAEYWLGNRALAAELRLRVAKFGATPEDRARLKVEVGQPDPAPKQGLQPAAKGKRRSRLLEVVKDDEAPTG